MMVVNGLVELVHPTERRSILRAEEKRFAHAMPLKFLNIFTDLVFYFFLKISRFQHERHIHKIVQHIVL